VARRFDRVGWAMDQSDLSAPQKHVLLILALAAAEVDGACWLAHSTIAERTGLGESTVRRVLTELADWELVVVNARFMENGKQTSNRYQLALPEEGAQSEHPAGASTSPARSEHHVEPITRTSRKNNSQTSSGSRSSRRASRARDDSGWDDPAAAVFATEQEPDDPAHDNPRSPGKRNPDSAWSLNGYYRQAVFVAGTGRVGNTNDGAMRKFFAEARRCGVRPSTLRAMVDCFVEDPQLFNRARTHRWKVFIANAPMLQERASNIIGVEPMEPGKEQFGGAIPKKVLDEILAEAG
jgi:hypothetical protein